MPAASKNREQAPAKLGTNVVVETVLSQPSMREALRKRSWNPAFLSHLGGAALGDPIRFELLAGVWAAGTVERSQFEAGHLVYVSGNLIGPEPGRFFFQKQTRTGVAGDYVGVVELPASQTAYRIEPSGPGRTPELVERPLAAVLCARLPRPAEAAKSRRKEAAQGIVRKVTDTPIPPYQHGIIALESLRGATPVIFLDFFGGYTATWGGVAYARPDVTNPDIFDVWSRVAEDYLPFNINVTTDLQVYQHASEGGRTRVIITPTDTAAAEAGGIAYIGSFNWTGDIPCWVYEYPARYVSRPIK